MRTRLAAALVVLAACNGKKKGPETPPKKDHLDGTFRLESDLEISGRIRIVKGAFLTAECRLAYTPTPEGADDGDSGENLFLKFKNPALVERGRTFDLQDPDLDVYLAQWASPHGYDIRPKKDLTGRVEVLEYAKDRELVLRVKVQAYDVKVKLVRE